ncbi:MAG: ABC transporter ATP-binding protein [Candidatus Methanomethylophilus sp.]|nr:ABC transporter ATP-binding protein [Methanomethylophilus sp.]MDD4222061.1 ABC transporter ATP-binding protein [Methanomethylophilus sp.]MDD4668531.1 ABC transporter ATP-binding protein [Methanomethylophilus sp.]
MPAEKMIVVSNLHKSYGEVKAVDGISFSVEKGQRFAFLGPNGAGKSTTISMMCTLLKSDSGTITIDGHDINDRNVKDSIGVVFQESLLDKDLTVRENIEFVAALYGADKKKAKETADSLSAEMELTDIIDRRYGKLSGGQRRRADIARALVHDPQVLFLDEPSTGLDPQSRKLIWKLTKRLCDRGLTLFFSTHYMEEATNADFIVIINNGRIAAQGTPDMLRREYSKDRIRMFPRSMEEVLRRLTDDGLEHRREGDAVIVNVPSTLSSVPIIDRYRETLIGFEVVMGSMDDAFINIVGGGEDSCQ